MKRKLYLSANCILAWLQFLLSLFYPAESAVRTCCSSKSLSQSPKSLESLHIYVEPKHLNGLPDPLAKHKIRCCPGEAPIPTDPFYLCGLFKCSHPLKGYLQLIN